jgi:hypothetical protein
MSDAHAEAKPDAPDRNDFEKIKTRLTEIQLERSVAAFYLTLPEEKAREAEAAMRRMYERARRWQA